MWYRVQKHIVYGDYVWWIFATCYCIENRRVFDGIETGLEWLGLRRQVV